MKSLTREELARLVEVASQHSAMDSLLIRVIFNHGLRVSEALALTDADIVGGHLIVKRLKGSKRTTQPLLPDEQELTSLRGRFFKICRRTFDRRMKTYGTKVGISILKLHAHVLRHTTGRLGFLGGMSIPDVQAYLGHVNGGNTLTYMQSTEEESCKAFSAAVGK